MYIAKLYRADEGFLTLTGHESDYQVVNITGLGSSSAHINAANYTTDGARFNGIRKNTKQIQITLKLNGDVDANRQEIYRFFRTKEPVRFCFESGGRSLYIDGYAQTAPCNMFEQQELMILTMICPDPFFRSDNEVVKSLTYDGDLFYFPFSIELGDPVEISTIDREHRISIMNDGDVPVGFEVEVDVYGPCQQIVLYNDTTGEGLGIYKNNYFFPRDVITFNTIKGQKGIWLERSGSETSLLSNVIAGSSFFQLARGENLISLSVHDHQQDHFVEGVLTFRPKYTGV